MRYCKGIKILLAICHSSHRGEDFLPQPEVSWNLRLSRVSFLLKLFLLSWFPAHWAFCHFPVLGFFCIQLPPQELSLSWASAVLSLCLVGGRAEVVSARLNPSHSTIDVGGVCNFLGSVSPQQKFETMDRPGLQLHVTAQFYWANKGKCILEA